LKRLSLPIGAIQRARELRRRMTKPERYLWRSLRSAFPDIRWRKQAPFGAYVVDFCCHSARLIIEVDGGQHAQAIDPDAERTRFLEAEGYRVVRFWNNDVLGNVDGVLQRIADTLSESRGPET
jgi:very-short-patch-repair endonuclease